MTTINTNTAAFRKAVRAAVAEALAAMPAPAKAKAGERVRSADGRDFPCTAGAVNGKACSRMLRSEGRAKIHGVDAGGHQFVA